ncbi:MAG TPA: hypothetical protein VNM39_13255 [Verrucomicrobiae bacterium]|nr:hypothetical protein [Verrucomicrobiae bacterium]
MSAHHAELGQRAVKTAEIALQALERITALLDEDCDETKVALYNPRVTVGNIRRELEQARDELTAAERAPSSLEVADAALASAPPYVVNACDCILCQGKQAHPPERLGEGPPVFAPEPTLRDLARRVAACERVAHDPDYTPPPVRLRLEHLERPIADRDAIVWEIGRSAGIRGDGEHLNPFRRRDLCVKCGRTVIEHEAGTHPFEAR